jgi:hypothetical protein
MALSVQRKALLAPVPYSRMAEALVTCQRRGLVAFGTMKKTVFISRERRTPLLPCGARVLIHVSETGAHEPAALRFLKGLVASYQATFQRWQDADPETGKHPDPSVRPLSTDSDGAWLGFYEVSDLVPCHVPLHLLRWARNGRLVKSPPHGPDLVIDIDP